MLSYSSATVVILATGKPTGGGDGACQYILPETRLIGQSGELPYSSCSIAVFLLCFVLQPWSNVCPIHCPNCRTPTVSYCPNPQSYYQDKRQLPSTSICQVKECDGIIP